MAFIQPMGTPVECYLAEYMRTVVYEIHGLFVPGDTPATSRVVDSTGFSAWVTTDPAELLEKENFSDQWNFVPGFPEAFRSKFEGTESLRLLHVVIQVKQNMDSFPATAGQCITVDHEGSEELWIVECADAPYPEPNDRKREITILLTAIRAEFETTGPLESQFDVACYRTTDALCLHPKRVAMNMTGRAHRPVSVGEIAARAESSRDLFQKISRNIEGDITEGRSRRKPDYGQRLEELAEALILEPSTDDSYLRRWYLRLCDRVEKFGESMSREVWNKSNERAPDMKDEKKHRNAIAHRGVEKVDGQLLNSLQAKTFGIIKSGLWPRERSCCASHT